VGSLDFTKVTEPMAPTHLPIVHYPDPILGRPAEDITEFDADLSELAEAMVVKMAECEGIGLAGPQVGVGKRIIIVSETGQAEDAVVHLNPRIVEASRDEIGFEEGCLSFPEIRGVVIRPEEVTVVSQDLDGEERRTEADGLLARVLQHEIDHVNGKLFITMFGPADRFNNRRRLRKLEKQYRVAEERR
jgi:peptide deformylase